MLTCARFSTTKKSSVRPLRTGGTKVGADVEPVDRNTLVKPYPNLQLRRLLGDLLVCLSHKGTFGELFWRCFV